MKRVAKTDEHTIYEKRSGRYAVKDKQKRWVRGDDKLAVLSAQGLVKAPQPKAAAPEPEAEAATAEEATASEGEKPAE
jgi:hypothetical protein